jgi:Domain of unknown function (DUF3332)
MYRYATIRKGGTAMRGSRFGKGIALLLAAALGALTAGCSGKFQLTRKLYDINQSIDDQYIRSVVTWLFILPYGITGILDFVVFNVIEFWSGENPVVSAPVTKVYARGNGKTVLTLSRDGSATVAVIDRYEGEALVSTLRVRDDGRGAVAAVETAGGEKVREVSAVAASDGTVSVTATTPAGTATERYAASAVRAHTARAARIAAEVRQATTGAAGTIPLAAAAPRNEIRATGVPPQREKQGARVPAYGG